VCWALSSKNIGITTAATKQENSPPHKKKMTQRSPQMFVGFFVCAMSI
jgi:hypothetical protein